MRSVLDMTNIVRVFWRKRAAQMPIITAVLSLLFSGALFLTPAAAMENLRLLRGVLILEGNVAPGDYILFRHFVSEESNFKKMNGNVFLASRGGSVSDAMQIGYLIRRLRLGTDAPSGPAVSAKGFGSSFIRAVDLANSNNYQCSSACFLIFAAGIHRDLFRAGRLGIHSPKIENKPIGVTENEVSIGMEGMRGKIKLYFEEMNVPTKYLDLMFSVSPKEIRWLTQSEFESDLKGYIPEVRALLDAKCGSVVETDSIEISKCIEEVRAQLRIEAWRQVFHRAD